MLWPLYISLTLLDWKPWADSMLLEWLVEQQTWCHADVWLKLQCCFCSSFCLNSVKRKLQVFCPTGQFIISRWPIHHSAGESPGSCRQHMSHWSTWHTSICTYFLIDHPSWMLWFLFNGCILCISGNKNTTRIVRPPSLSTEYYFLHSCATKCGRQMLNMVRRPG